MPAWGRSLHKVCFTSVLSLFKLLRYASKGAHVFCQQGPQSPSGILARQDTRYDHKGQKSGSVMDFLAICPPSTGLRFGMGHLPFQGHLRLASSLFPLNIAPKEGPSGERGGGPRRQPHFYRSAEAELSQQLPTTPPSLVLGGLPRSMHSFVGWTRGKLRN